MPKYEYEYIIQHIETYRVFVEADSEEEAKELAEDKYFNGEAELECERTETELNWTDDNAETELNWTDDNAED